MTIQHKNLPDSGLHELKGVATAAEGTVPRARSGATVWEEPPFGTQSGWFDYHDTATIGTPIVVTGGAGYVFLTNDTLGVITNRNFPPPGVTDVWDPVLNKFDWDQLKVGDTVDIRLDVLVTTTGANQTFDIQLEVNTDGTPFSIAWDSQLAKTSGVQPSTTFNSIFIGSEAVRTGKARFKIQSDANATVVVNGWYVKVQLNGL